MAKKHLIGLKNRAIQCLGDMSLMRPKVEIDLYNDVLPWLLAKRDEFLGDAKSSVEVSEEVVWEGVVFHKNAHAEFLKNRQLAIEQAELKKQQEEEATKIRRADRAKAREKRAKDQAKDQLRNEVRRLLIEKS